MVQTAEPVLLATPSASPDELIDVAIGAARCSDAELQAQIDQMPVPIYLTDAEGWVTYFNRACADFAGRTPVAGEDRWCVTWRLHTEGGAFLPHEQCPMAVAIRERRPVRGAIAVAERPDGTRVLFSPYPTPILDEDGLLTGAVNILIDVTDRRQAEALKVQALRCRRLARSVSDPRTVKTLTLMAADYEQKARSLAKS
jgi:PAS domain S-box-containing protein